MKRRVHYVLSTHWDREWYQTFQDYRYRLVKLLDHVIAGWQEGKLKGPFQTDGQAIILEDYLEVRPERRKMVEQMAREGKFVIGPWYVLPDEFTVSGESLVRNLRLGREVARSFGAEPSAAGFVCDIFGHNSQMPQILTGFGIKGGFIWRGTNTQGKRNVMWKGADGTLLPCFRFGLIGYCDFAARVRGARGTSPCDNEPQAFLERLDEYLNAEAALTDVDPLLAFDGCDHQGWDQAMYAVLLERMEQNAGDYELVHTSLDQFLSEMLPQQARITTKLEGELREPGWETRQPGQDAWEIDQQWLIPGVLSSRIRLKQANSVCQTLLCHWAEPLASYASALLGDEYPYPLGFLNVAWRWLVQNHPHDSIDGCSIDQVHRDMAYRFDQSRIIGERLTTEAMHHIAASVKGDLAERELRVAVFNSLPRDVDEVVELELQIPPDWPTFNEFFGFEPKPAFRIYDSDGRELPYQRLGQDKNGLRWRISECRFPEGVRYHEVKVALRLSVPALGYHTLTVRAGHEGEFIRHPGAHGLATSERSMENEYLRVEVKGNGTLKVTDKGTGQIYRRLLTFEDVADIGDGWFHGAAVNDQAFVSTACQAQVALVHDSPLLTTFRVRTKMPVPARFEFGRMRRADEFVDLVMDSLVTLRQGRDFVEVQTTVDNVAEDHRLRVLLASGVRTVTYLADSAFDVVERPIPVREDNHMYRELEVETKPQQSWTAVFDAERGLAVVADGLLETAVRDLPERPVALTLFRATGRTVGTTGEPEGQMSGKLTFDYWIVPLAGAPDRTYLCELGQKISAGLKVAQLGPHDIPIYRMGERDLPPKAGFLHLTGPAVMTSLRQVDGAIEARIFNPLKSTVSATLEFGDRPAGTPRPSQAQRVDLESSPLGEPWAIDGAVRIKLKPKEIATLRMA